MAIPKVTVSLVEGALGIPPEQTDNKMVVMGYCTLGTTNALYDFDQASPSTVKATLGTGRLAQLVASLLATPNHGPIVAVPLASTAGVLSAVTSAGTTPPTVTLTGNSTDDFTLRVEILTAGARGVATFRYSLDYNTASTAAATWSGEITTAATYVIPDSGITLNFATGTDYAVDNRYSATGTAPTHSNTNVTDGIDAVIANGVDFGWMYIAAACGGVTDANRVTALASLFTVVSAKVDALETAYKFIGCTLEAPSPVATDAAGLTTWRGALTSGMAASSHKRMQVAAGYVRRAADMTIVGYSLPRRPAGWSVCERISAAPISEHLGNILNGKLRGIVSIEHDEETTGGLDSDAARFTTLRTVAGRQGFFVCRGRQFASTGSDYSMTPRLRVINTASKTLRNGALNYLNSSVLVDSSTGKIREDEALAIDADLTSQLNAVLVQPAHASSAAARVSRTDLILSTSTLNVEGAIQPVGYAETIPLSLGFTRTTSAAA